MIGKPIVRSLNNICVERARVRERARERKREIERVSLNQSPDRLIITVLRERVCARASERKERERMSVVKPIARSLVDISVERERACTRASERERKRVKEREYS